MKIKLIKIIPGVVEKMEDNPTYTANMKGSASYQKHQNNPDNTIDIYVRVAFYLGGIGKDSDECCTIGFLYDVKDVKKLPKATGVAIELCKRDAEKLAVPIYRTMTNYKEIKVIVEEGKETIFPDEEQKETIDEDATKEPELLA